MTLTELFAGQPVMAILRNFSTERSVELAHRAWDLGIDIVEVPIQTSDAVPALEAVIAAGRERGRTVGAGTVITPEQVDLSTRLGAGFTVAPGLSRDVVERSAKAGTPHLPGIATASEIQAAMALGCDWVKAFPASLLGTEWFRAMRGPFPALNFVATGGLTAQNAAPYLDAGVRCVALGSALADPQQADELVSILKDRAREGSEPTP